VAKDETVRVFAGAGAGIAHLVPRFALDHVTFGAPSTLCGRARPWRSAQGWHGWRHVSDIERAETLSLCKLCERKADRG